MDDVYNKDFTLYVGSTFTENIEFAKIYVDTEELGNYTLSAGMKLKSNTTLGFVIPVSIGNLNVDFTMLMPSSTSGAISPVGDYLYAVDLTDTDASITKTILTGTITVKEDISNV